MCVCIWKVFSTKSVLLFIFLRTFVNLITIIMIIISQIWERMPFTFLPFLQSFSKTYISYWCTHTNITNAYSCLSDFKYIPLFSFLIQNTQSFSILFRHALSFHSDSMSRHDKRRKSPFLKAKKEVFKFNSKLLCETF